MFFVIKRIATLARPLKITFQGLSADQSTFGDLGQAMLGNDSINFFVRQKRQKRLAHPGTMHKGAAPRCNKSAHHLAAFNLRQENNLATVCNRQIDGFTAVFHQGPHIGPGNLAKIAVFGKGVANAEGLYANGP